MKTMAMSLIVVLLLTGGLLAQRAPELRIAGMDLLGALNGDMEKFERGMRTLESLLAKNPKDPEVKILYGNGVFARSGLAFQKGDMQNAMKLWQSGLDEMAQAVELAPDNIYVRARRADLVQRSGSSAVVTSTFPSLASRHVPHRACLPDHEDRATRPRSRALRKPLLISSHRSSATRREPASCWRRRPGRAR